MAIIKCPECGQDVSDTCEKCIHCGYQLRKPSTPTSVSSSSYSKPIHTESHASKIYERDQHIKWIGGIVASVLCFIIAIVFFVLAGLKEVTGGYGEIKTIFIVGGIILIITGIGGIIYYRYRLNNY